MVNLVTSMRLIQDKVSKLTGAIAEPRESRSGPAGFGAGRYSVSRSEVDRPLLEPGEVRALPGDIQLTFAAGHRPMRTRKVQYDRRRPFRDRADQPPPDQAIRIDSPGWPIHPWAGRRSLGEDAQVTLPLRRWRPDASSSTGQAKAAPTRACVSNLKQESGWCG